MVSYPYSLYARFGGSAESIATYAFNFLECTAGAESATQHTYSALEVQAKKRRPKGALGRTSVRVYMPRLIGILQYEHLPNTCTQSLTTAVKYKRKDASQM
jgi:hypothetical protein